MQQKLLAEVVLAASVAVLSFSSFAIDETESLRQRSQSKPQFTNLSLDFAGKRGNSDTEQFAFGVYHSQKLDKHFGFIMASREYATSNGVESADNAFLHLRYNYYLHERQALELLLQSNINDFRSLESRELVGANYRFELGPKQAAGIGVFHEEEDYFVENKPIHFQQDRLNLYWVFAGDVNQNFSVSSTLYYQPNVENFDDWRAFFQASLRSKLTDNIFMKVGFLLEHDSKPVLDVEKTDFSYKAGFEFEF